jgi:transaldolase
MVLPTDAGDERLAECPVVSSFVANISLKGVGQMQTRLVLDCADIDQIEKAIQSGVIGGIATNSTKIAEAGKSVEQVVREIRSIFDGFIAVQTVSSRAEDLIREAKDLNELGSNMSMKIATTFEGVKAIDRLAKDGIQTNATLIFTPAQALVAGLAGASVISPFVGRARDVGIDAIATIGRIRKVYDAFGIQTPIIAASIRSKEQVIDSIIAGADMVALRYEIFEQLFRHPLTDEGAAKFLEDTLRSRGG